MKDKNDEIEIERRFDGEIRAGEGRKIVGYAAVFNRNSNKIGGEKYGFVETIAPGAFDGVIKKSDVFALLNHDDRRGVLARSKEGEGSLTLTIDDKGLKYEFEAPNTALGDELLEGVRRGDITASSFAFSVEKETWFNESANRRIDKIARLYDVSPVYRPAYPDTSVALAKRNAAAGLEAYYEKLLKSL